VIKDNKYNLRSNGRTLVPWRSKYKFGDLRFKNFFANYVNFFRLFDLNLLVSTFIHSFLSNKDLYVKNFLRLTPKYNLNLDYYFYK
jgi:hypothetical protein